MVTILYISISDPGPIFKTLIFQTSVVGFEECSWCLEIVVWNIKENVFFSVCPFLPRLPLMRRMGRGSSGRTPAALATTLMCSWCAAPGLISAERRLLWSSPLRVNRGSPVWNPLFLPTWVRMNSYIVWYLIRALFYNSSLEVSSITYSVILRSVYRVTNQNQQTN